MILEQVTSDLTPICDFEFFYNLDSETIIKSIQELINSKSIKVYILKEGESFMEEAHTIKNLDNFIYISL